MENSFDEILLVKPDERDRLSAYVSKQKTWFHRFVFDAGLTTPGVDPSSKKLYHLCLPRSLKGKTVLDVGAYDGFFSFHCEARGAKHVVASDNVAWNWPGSTALKNFTAVHHGLGSKVKTVDAAVENLPRAINEKYEVVLFLGVLYHAPNMIGYLDAVSKMTSQVLVLETMVDALQTDGARIAIYDNGELNNDLSNWFGPNLRAVDIMLRRVGFRHVEFMNMWDVNTIGQFQKQSPFQQLKSGRAVIHAYK